jgi:phage terminase small subunit
MVMTAKRKLPARRAEWGQLGPAMKALPNDQWREFVYQYVIQPAGHGALVAAARAAGYGQNSSPANLAKIAWRMSRDERMIAAIAEESQKIIRVAGPEAANALLSLVRDPTHREHGRAVALVLERTDPVTTRHDVNVTHKIIYPDTEAIEELRALRTIGAPREKLIELFGQNGLDRIERLEAAHRADTAKVIEGDFTEVHDG